jgi:RNA ligase
VKIQDLFSFARLDEMLTEGYVRFRMHPRLPYNIYNYTEKAAYEGVWNEVTTQCRGLIVDRRTGEILARPFPKFMNYGQTGAAEIALDEAVSVTDKMDGSLGILYRTSDGYAIATRGSFESEQAIHATETLREKYLWNFAPARGFTYLFEIVYPENRIVLDYGDMDDLVLLGAVDIETGHIQGPGSSIPWPGPRTEVFNYETFADALAAPPRDNAEGLVVRTYDDRMLKIKQEDYVALHRIVTGLSEKTVWEALSNGTFDELLEKVPDEFHEWLKNTGEKFHQKFFVIAREAYDAFHEIEDYLLDRDLDLSDRKAFAKCAMTKPAHLRPMLFKNLDTQSYADIIWKQIRPVGFTPMKITSEDVA